jgi:hypothetical protein
MATEMITHVDSEMTLHASGAWPARLKPEADGNFSQFRSPAATVAVPFVLQLPLCGRIPPLRDSFYFYDI